MVRAKTILFLSIATAIGITVGAAAATLFVGSFVGNAMDSRFIADATIYSTVLEKIKDGDTDTASRVLKQQLNVAMLGLTADFSHLSASQRDQYVIIQKRLAGLNVDTEQNNP